VRDPGKALPYPVSALPEVLAGATREMIRVIQAPDAVAAASVVAAASLVVQAHADVEIDGRVIPLSLWLLTVSESGERKSAVDNVVLDGIRKFERGRARDFEKDMAKHRAALRVHKFELDKAAAEARKLDGDAARDHVAAVGDDPEPPLRPQLTAADFTTDGIVRLLTECRPSIGIFSDDGGVVFGGHSMTKETVVRTAATLSKLWDRGEIDRIRVVDGASRLWGRRLALHVMVQPVIALQAFGSEVLDGQGFLARCLVSWPETRAGTRPYVRESVLDTSEVADLSALFQFYLGCPLPVSPESRSELQPRRIKLDPDAYEYFVFLHDSTEAQMAPMGRYAHVRAWASKSTEQVLRVAGVFALCRDISTDTISLDDVQRAGAVVGWHMNEAARLAGASGTAETVALADELRQWFTAREVKQTYVSQILRYGPNKFRDRDLTLAALQTLESAGYVVANEAGAVVDGRPRKVSWMVKQVLVDETSPPPAGPDPAVAHAPAGAIAGGDANGSGTLPDRPQGVDRAGGAETGGKDSGDE